MTLKMARNTNVLAGGRRWMEAHGIPADKVIGINIDLPASGPAVVTVRLLVDPDELVYGNDSEGPELDPR